MNFFLLVLLLTYITHHLLRKLTNLKIPLTMACNCDGHSHSKITHWSCDECNGTWAYGNGVVQPREIRFSTDTNFEMNSVQYLLCENCYSEAPVDCCNCGYETTHEQLEDDGCMECGLGVYSDGSGIQCHECRRIYSDCCDWRNGYSKLDWFYGDCCEEKIGVIGFSFVHIARAIKKLWNTTTKCAMKSFKMNIGRN